MNYPKLLLSLALATLLTTGCVRVYKIDVQQGNDLSERQLEGLDVGMDRQQVRALLGTPLIDDPFRQDRWDYFYALREGNSKDTTRRRMSLYFEGETLARIDGGLETETVRQKPVDVEEMIEEDREREKALAEAQRADQAGFWDGVSAALRRIEGE